MPAAVAGCASSSGRSAGGASSARSSGTVRVACSWSFARRTKIAQPSEDEVPRLRLKPSVRAKAARQAVRDAPANASSRAEAARGGVSQCRRPSPWPEALRRTAFEAIGLQLRLPERVVRGRVHLLHRQHVGCECRHLLVLAWQPARGRSELGRAVRMDAARFVPVARVRLGHQVVAHQPQPFAAVAAEAARTAGENRPVWRHEYGPELE
eukprot:2535288-Prymnesium_polylepis.2